MNLAPVSVLPQAGDGYALQALHDPARGPRVGHMLVAGATGVPQRYHRRFAEFAAERGLGPLIVKAKGCLAWSLMGMGEELPRDVFYRWRCWCQ